MPRIPRGQLAGHAYHVLDRGNDEAVIYHMDTAYLSALRVRPIPLRLTHVFKHPLYLALQSR